MFGTVRGWMCATLFGIFNYRKGEDSRPLVGHKADLTSAYRDFRFQG
jgi:hypothetical protein